MGTEPPQPFLEELTEKVVFLRDGSTADTHSGDQEGLGDKVCVTVIHTTQHTIFSLMMLQNKGQVMTHRPSGQFEPSSPLSRRVRVKQPPAPVEGRQSVPLREEGQTPQLSLRGGLPCCTPNHQPQVTGTDMNRLLRV